MLQGASERTGTHHILAQSAHKYWFKFFDDNGHYT